MNSHITATISCCQNLIRTLQDSWLCIAFTQLEICFRKNIPLFSCKLPVLTDLAFILSKSIPFKICSRNLLNSHLNILIGQKYGRIEKVTLCPDEIQDVSLASAKYLTWEGWSTQDLFHWHSCSEQTLGAGKVHDKTLKFWTLLTVQFKPWGMKPDFAIHLI